MTSGEYTIRVATRKDIGSIVNLWFESATYHGELDPHLQVNIDERASVRVAFEKDMKVKRAVHSMGSEGGWRVHSEQSY